MSKFEARFQGSPAHVVSELLSLGLVLRNPGAGNIQAFSCDGDEVLIDQEDEAIKFLLRGNGISLWLAPDHDFFVSVQGKHLTGYFDGFTPEEQEALVSRMRGAGLSFDVRHEDESDPRLTGGAP